mmetsp:Transcript_7731/g.18689  ORF Transcript_7731/g.18689 Transcript_7731/m.18689 type:complete len:356 (+) Transcript_7731:2241-3308(+)
MSGSRSGSHLLPDYHRGLHGGLLTRLPQRVQDAAVGDYGRLVLPHPLAVARSFGHLGLVEELIPQRQDAGQLLGHVAKSLDHDSVRNHAGSGARTKLRGFHVLEQRFHVGQRCLRLHVQVSSALGEAGVPVQNRVQHHLVQVGRVEGQVHVAEQRGGVVQKLDPVNHARLLQQQTHDQCGRDHLPGPGLLRNSIRVGGGVHVLLVLENVNLLVGVGVGLLLRLLRRRGPQHPVNQLPSERQRLLRVLPHGAVELQEVLAHVPALTPGLLSGEGQVLLDLLGRGCGGGLRSCSCCLAPIMILIARRRGPRGGHPLRPLREAKRGDTRWWSTLSKKEFLFIFWELSCCCNVCVSELK